MASLAASNMRGYPIAGLGGVCGRVARKKLQKKGRLSPELKCSTVKDLKISIQII